MIEPGSRIGKLDNDKAGTLISGGYERRRGYLTAAMYTVNQVTVATTVAIWGYLIRWDLILGKGFDWNLLANEAAWAGALSSIVIGVWRIYERQLDADVIRLYPALYLCERLYLPAEICTVNPPEGIAALSKSQILTGFEFREIRNESHWSRGHAFEDWAGVGAIALFSIVSVGAGWWAGVITFRVGWPHPIGLMLLGNITGLASIGDAYRRWRKKTVQWPVPMTTGHVQPA